MKGILLISHGEMAYGLAQTAKLFFGERIEQFEFCCLNSNDHVNEFRQRIKQKVACLNTGEGVLILADILGGSPGNQAALCLTENVDLIMGMNLPMLMQALCDRQAGTFNLDQIKIAAQEGIVNVKLQFALADDEDWLENE